MEFQAALGVPENDFAVLRFILGAKKVVLSVLILFMDRTILRERSQGHALKKLIFV